MISSLTFAGFMPSTVKSQGSVNQDDGIKEAVVGEDSTISTDDSFDESGNEYGKKMCSL